MTVSSIVVRAVAVWSGVETEFPTGVQILDRTQLVVSLVPDEGAAQVLTLGLHYSVSLSPAGVATVAPLGSFPATPGVVSFVRQTPMTQSYDPTATDTYDAAGHAAALDRSAMRVAELSVKVDDIAASSIVVADGAASVPVGAVYVSNGEGGAIAGPTAAEIETARAAAVSAAGTATGAAGVATGAATTAGNAAMLADQLANAAPDTPVGTGFSARHWVALAQALSDAFDLGSYSTTAQIEAKLEGFAPTGRKIKVGSGLSLDGTAGSDEETAEGDLSADRLIKLLFATEAEIAAGEITDKPVHPAGMAAAIAALASGGIKHVRLVTASGAVTPSLGVKKWLGLLVGGGAGGQAAYQGYPGAGGSGAGLTMFLATVSDATTYPLVIGAGGTAGAGAHGNAGGAGGASSLVIAGTTYSATGGAVTGGTPGVGSGGIVNMTGQRGVSSGLSASGAGGGSPLGIGLGGAAVQQSGAPQMNTGLPGSGFGAGGSGGYRNSGASYQDIMFAGVGTAGALILLEF